MIQYFHTLFINKLKIYFLSNVLGLIIDNQSWRNLKHSHITTTNTHPEAKTNYEMSHTAVIMMISQSYYKGGRVPGFGLAILAKTKSCNILVTVKTD